MIAEFESMAQEDINKISEAAKEGGDPLGPQLDRYVSKFKELFIKIIVLNLNIIVLLNIIMKIQNLKLIIGVIFQRNYYINQDF
jgi:hypothetical protein